MTTLNFIITESGREAAINADATGATVTISEIAIGSSSWEPDENATELQDEIKRFDSSGGPNPHPLNIHVTFTDDSTDSYSVKEIGLFLDDESSTLFAIVSTSENIIDKYSEGIAAGAFDIALTGIPSGSVTVGDANFAYPLASETVAGVMLDAPENDKKYLRINDGWSEDESLQKPKNLGDLKDKSESRTNLDVYSKSEVDSKYETIDDKITTVNNELTIAEKHISILKKSLDEANNIISIIKESIGYALLDFGTVKSNNRYVKNNPFGNNTPVILKIELFAYDKWSSVGWIKNNGAFQGCNANYVEGEGIVVQTCISDVMTNSDYTGGGHGVDATLDSAPCRVHVWKLNYTDH